MNWQFMQRWHRRFGITIALIVLLLVVTGILLNHTSDLDLRDRYVTAEWLLDWYEIKPEKTPVGFQAGGVDITQMGDRVFFNDREIRETVRQLHGAVDLETMIVIGLDSQLLLLDKQGQVIDQLDGMDGVPSGMRQLGVDTNGQIIIRAAHGDYRLDLEHIGWEEEDEIQATWSLPQAIREELNQVLLDRYRGRGLPMERVLLDLHSGRILGQWGVLLIDLSALLLFILAITGIYLWFKHR